MSLKNSQERLSIAWLEAANGKNHTRSCSCLFNLRVSNILVVEGTAIWKPSCMLHFGSKSSYHLDPSPDLEDALTLDLYGSPVNSASAHGEIPQLWSPCLKGHPLGQGTSKAARAWLLVDSRVIHTVLLHREVRRETAAHLHFLCLVVFSHFFSPCT